MSVNKTLVLQLLALHLLRSSLAQFRGDFFPLYRFCDFTYGIVREINKLTLALCVKMSAATADLTEQTSHISIFHQSVL